jgi:hypothetical protein
MEPEERRLGHEASTDFVVVPETASVADARAAGAAWAVITDAGSRPARLVSAAELARLPGEYPVGGARARPVLVLPAGLPVSYVTRTAQFARGQGGLLNIGGIVVYDESPAKPAGVWAGPSFQDFMLPLALEFPSARTFDPTLPGRISIPPVERACAFTEAAVVCGSSRKFDQLPDDMPACDNPRRLTAHLFTW